MRNNILSHTEKLFLTDGGLETELIFKHGIDLPHFASFPIIDNKEQKSVIIEYYKDFISAAKKFNKGFILESPTWRANPEWGFKLGYNRDELIRLNKAAIKELLMLKKEYEDEETPMLISGCIGPRGDGYSPDFKMGIEEATEFHSFQIKALKDAGVDMISALTINYLEEAIGIVKASQINNIPVIISFTVETDGKLPSGTSLNDAITQVDKLTDLYVEYYMINCAHPNHFKDELNSDSNWISRIGGIRANASEKSHQELDESTELDSGDRCDLAKKYRELTDILPNLRVVGGCCGTDIHHIEEICKSLTSEYKAAI